MNNRTNISLLLPTRGRPTQLQRLFDSIVSTSANPEALEIVLYIDEDDLPTQEASHSSLSLVKLINAPGENMGLMNQMCYEASHGRYVMLMNDDVVFRTKHWDLRVSDTFGRFPDEIALVYGNDLHQKESLPTLPILSRTFCEMVGGVCPREYRNTYVDLHLFDVFKKLAKLGHDRIAYLENVVFEHMHHEAGKSVTDRTYVKKDERADDLLFINLEDDRWNQAKTLRRYIDERGKESQARSGPEQTDKKLSEETRCRPASLLRRWFASRRSRDRI